MATVGQLQWELADREAIRDCLHRYCRGIDRREKELILSAYWPGALDDHIAFKGTVEDFVEYFLGGVAAMDQTQHRITNILFAIDGSAAGVESYVNAFHRIRRPDAEPFDMIFAGRFLDKFERREGEWRIAERLLVCDWFRNYPDSADWSHGPLGWDVRPGGHWPDDRSYDFLEMPQLWSWRQ